MKHTINLSPKTDKEGLQNQVKMIANVVENGDCKEASLLLDALIDDLSPKRVRFNWGHSTYDQRESIARFACENPDQVD